MDQAVHPPTPSVSQPPARQPAAATPTPTSQAVPPPVPPAASKSATPPAPDSSPNAAVLRCCSAYEHALAAGTKDKADQAYKRALPFLTTRTSVRDFIACIAHGMVLGVFWNDQGPRLLIAAKAALAAIPPDPRPVGRPKSTEPLPVPEN